MVYHSVHPLEAQLAWPKMIEIGKIRVPVDSWEELREALVAFEGFEITVAPDDAQDDSVVRRSASAAARQGLGPADRSLLADFIEAGQRGVLIQHLSQALGKRGKGVRPALEAWSRRIGLVTEDGAVAFEPIKRFDGRAYRMHGHYIRVANQMLGR